MRSTPVLHLYSIIPHTREPRLLLIPNEGGWSLPHRVSTEPHPGIVGHIHRALKARWDIDVTVLQCVHNSFDPVTMAGGRIYTLENHSPGWTPPSPARWIAHDELRSLRLSIPAHRPVLDAWFAEVREKDVPHRRAVWARFGWYETAAQWIYEQLDRLRIKPIGPIEQLRAWSISCILRIPAAAGHLYFKAVSSTFSYAPCLVRELAKIFPEHTPSTLAVDCERGWILMQDFGGRTLDQIADRTSWAQAVRRFGHIQAGSVGHSAHWLEIGCPNLGLDWVKAQIDIILSDRGAMLPGQHKGLSMAEAEQLPLLGPRLAAACERLAACGVPNALVHNDFHAGNVISTDAQLIIFDWADSAVTHPFFSLTSLLDAETFVSDSPTEWISVRNAYLKAWTDYLPMQRLIEAFDLALPVGALYHALNHRRVVEQIEARSRWELEATVPYWLRKVLLHRDNLPGVT